MKILGVDPGVTTGGALISWNGELPVNPGNAKVICVWQMEFQDVPSWAQEWIPRVDHIAVERFHITGRTVQNTRQYEPLYVIGGIVFLLQLNLEDAAKTMTRTCPKLHLNSASNAKNAWSNGRLKEMGFYEQTVGSPHARDALRHALLCCHSV